MFGGVHGAMRLLGFRVVSIFVNGIGCHFVSARHLLCLWTSSPCVRALGMSFSFTIGLSKCLKISCLKRGLLSGGTCVWRSAVFGRELLEIDVGMRCGLPSGLHTVILF
jgi:hypothetical protein